MKVTDEMLSAAQFAYDIALVRANQLMDRRLPLKAALEAAFAMNDLNRVTSPQLEPDSTQIKPEYAKIKLGVTRVGTGYVEVTERGGGLACTVVFYRQGSDESTRESFLLPKYEEEISEPVVPEPEKVSTKIPVGWHAVDEKDAGGARELYVIGYMPEERASYYPVVAMRVDDGKVGLGRYTEAVFNKLEPKSYTRADMLAERREEAKDGEPKKATLLEYLGSVDPRWRNRDDFYTLELISAYLEQK